MMWSVVRLVDVGQYAVAREVSGQLEYGNLDGKMLRTPDIEKARAAARKLNSPGITQEAFDILTSHVQLRDKTRGALHAVMVDGYTWKAAAARHGITESGISRAMRRIARLNPQHADRLSP